MVDFFANRRVVVGKGSAELLTSYLEQKHISSVFLVTFSLEVNFVRIIKNRIEKCGIRCVCNDLITGEPDTDMMDNGAAFCRESNCQAVIAIGGGSVIDTGKAIAMMATNGGRAQQYQLEGRLVTNEPLLFIAIPTTAGTGAEATKVSVVYNKEKGWKKSIYHTSMIAQAVFLDSDATLGLPSAIAASTGMDAITHAIESYVSLDANAISRMYSLRALGLLSRSIESVVQTGGSDSERENMLLGSYFAGCAISVGCGLVWDCL